MKTQLNEMHKKVAEYEADEEANYLKRRAAAKHIQLTQIEKMRMDRQMSEIQRRQNEKELYLSKKRKKEYDAIQKLEKARHARVKTEMAANYLKTAADNA